MALLVVASGLYRLIAERMRGYADAQAKQIFRDIIDMPAGSTPLDFAYHVHTDIGHRCRGARINGKLVPLHHELKTGDQVEILTAKRGGPSRDWLNSNLGLVNTQRARSKIRQWFKKEDYQQNLAQGRILLERELQRLGLTQMNFEDIARGLEFKTPDEMFVDLGTGDLSVSRVIRELTTEESDSLLTAGTAAGATLAWLKEIPQVVDDIWRLYPDASKIMQKAGRVAVVSKEVAQRALY